MPTNDRDMPKSDARLLALMELFEEMEHKKSYEEREIVTRKAIPILLELDRQLSAPAAQVDVTLWMLQNGFATGHGDSTADLLKELTWQVKELREAAKPHPAPVQSQEVNLTKVRDFLSSFSVTVCDNYYKDVNIGLHSPHSLVTRVNSHSDKSWIFADLEKRRQEALLSITAATQNQPAGSAEVSDKVKDMAVAHRMTHTEFVDTAYWEDEFERLLNETIALTSGAKK